ncbi:hypothetical protein DMENIID0001_059000 [Sergentomyia squamirostris]
MQRFRLPAADFDGAAASGSGYVDGVGGKVLEKSLADSGYTSELSKASESQLSHQSREASIEEDIEIDENQEPPTPTTRNLQKFSALQLNTPSSNGDHQSPLKRRCLDDHSVTPKKFKQQVDDYETPKKLQFARKKSFRDRIQSDHKSPALSPISSNISKSASKILGENQFENLSSTPIKGGFRPDFYVETVENIGWNPLLPKSRSPKLKRKLLKKIQSFSPRKWQVSKGFGKRFEQCPSPIPLDAPTTSKDLNPAHGLIAFNVQQFENLLNVEKHSSSNEDIKVEKNVSLGNVSRQQSSLLETVEEEEIDGINIMPLAQISSQSIREYFHELKNKTEEIAVEETGTVCQSSKMFRHKNSLDLLDLPHVPESSHEEMDISLTPTSQRDPGEGQRNSSRKRSSNDFEYSPSVLQTPKKVRRSTSFQYSSDEEKHRILYPQLPLTPPKKRAKKSLDYTTPSPAKKRLDYRGSERTPRKCQPPKRNSYEGATTLNILSRLAGTLPALDRIFRHLDARDLEAVHNVCSDWRRIVNEHRQAKERLRIFQLEQIPIKENNYVAKMIPSKKLSTERYHFRELNVLSSEEQLRQQRDLESSPPSSPSTRKFRDHQKFLQRLDDDARVVHCPQCMKSSLIMSPRRRKRCAMAMGRVSPMKRSSPARRTLFYKPNTTICALPSVRPEDKMLGRVGKSQSLPDTLSSFERELCTKNKSLISGDGIEYTTYAICSRESCRFAFCIKCFRERHEVGKCVEIEPLSPMKAEEEFRLRIIPGSKRSKKNLKRL